MPGEINEDKNSTQRPEASLSYCEDMGIYPCSQVHLGKERERNSDSEKNIPDKKQEL